MFLFTLAEPERGHKKLIVHSHSAWPLSSVLFSVQGIVVGWSNVQSVREPMYSYHIQHPFYYKTWAKRHTDHKQKRTQFQMNDFKIIEKEYQLKKQPPTSIWNTTAITTLFWGFSWVFKVVKLKHFPVYFLWKLPPSVKKSFLLILSVCALKWLLKIVVAARLLVSRKMKYEETSYQHNYSKQHRQAY